MAYINLSYWEKKAYFQNLDFAVLGLGLVGMSTAYHLRQKYPTASITIIDSASLSQAATFKNAGFACFGSPGEILSDYQSIGKPLSLETIRMRLKGLDLLNQFASFDQIAYQACSSWELFSAHNKSDFEQISSQIDDLNKDLNSVFGYEANPFAIDHTKCKESGFENLQYAIQNKLEGSIDTALLNKVLYRKLAQNNIDVVKGVPVSSFEDQGNKVCFDTPFGIFETRKLIVATNGFTSKILPELNVKPARAQVIVTEPIPKLRVNGTFHLNEGYDYFRNIDGRILLGGGRNLNLEGEETDKFGQTEQIQSYLENLLRTSILPEHSGIAISQTWSGIMGVGSEKKPLIGKYSPNISYGVRMGGMGVAIGTWVGQQIAEMN